MAVSTACLELLRDLLSALGPVTARRMFGGASLYADGMLFALVDDDVLYLKADQTTKARYESEGLKPFTYQGQTGPVSMSYWRAPERLYDEPDEMLEWAQEALRVAALSKKSAATGKTKRAIVRPGPKSKTAKTTRRTSEKSARS